MIWTDKHDDAINRTFKELCGALSGSKDGRATKEKLSEMGWTYGPQGGPETPSARVRRELANMAIVERCKVIMEQELETT
tara:strand:+ start:448 stop:687 length:240 start_codon:yes stop_codon:yes gene_type:complete